MTEPVQDNPDQSVEAAEPTVFDGITKLLIYGVPKKDVEYEFGIECEYIANLDELCDTGDRKMAVAHLLSRSKRGEKVYLCKTPRTIDERIFRDMNDMLPTSFLDEGLLLLETQIGGTATNKWDFQEIFYGMAASTGRTGGVIFMATPDENTLVFHERYRASQTHEITWFDDDTIEVDGMVMRPTAVVAQGWLQSRVLGQGVLQPSEVVGFLAARLASNGVNELLGYGRAFGPGKEDHTNAALTPAGRKFRAKGLVGVVMATLGDVTKAKPDMVIEVAHELRLRFPKIPCFLHQQCKEIYWGEAALEAFRATVNEDGTITMGAKSTKHARVDSGAYVLYTEDGTCMLEVDALIGQFEESNDGGIYCPKSIMDTLGGYLKETVRATKDFRGMSQALIMKYYNYKLMVVEGQRIEPGDPVFEIDGQVHTWRSKADYGFVTGVEDVMTRELVKVHVEIDAWFMGDLKVRGLGKGLVCSAEAAGISSMLVDELGNTEKDGRMVIGAAGIFKDSRAARDYILDPVEVIGAVTTEYCAEDYDRAKLKHQPEEDTFKMRPWPGHHIKTYGSVILRFNDEALTVTTVDLKAIACRVRVQIEASPVAQSVGSSSLTMPQLAFISSFESGNAWLTEQVLPRAKKRVNALTYLWAVANRIPLSTT